MVCVWSVPGLNVDERWFLLTLQTVKQKTMERYETVSWSMSTLNRRISGVSSAGLLKPEPEDRDASVPRGTISFPDKPVSQCVHTHTHTIQNH